MLQRITLLLITIGIFTLGSGESAHLSVIQLIATPQKYHRQQVRVVGFLHVNFEGNALYLSEGDGKHGITKNALWLEFDEDCYRELHNKYVFLEGVFDAQHHGHLKLYSGKLQVERIILWD